MCQSEKGCFKLCKKFLYRKCEGDIGEAVEQEDKLCDEVEAEREVTYFVNRVTAGRGCEADVTIRT